MAPFRRRAPVQETATQGVAKGSTTATSMGSAPSSSRRFTESSDFTAFETDFGPLAPRSAPAAPGLVVSGPAEPAPAITAPAATPTKNLFRQFMQAYMGDRRNSAPAPAPAPIAEPLEDISDRPLKAWNSDLYYGNPHMECYHFCQQYENHFETAGAKGHKHEPFAAFFLKDCILHRW